MARGKRGQGQGESKTSKRRIEARVREGQCLTLRYAGVSYAEIAEQVKITPTAVDHCLARAFKRVGNQDTAEKLRQVELGRLDRMLMAVWKRALGDPAHGIEADLAAFDRVLRIMERRERYIPGLAVPTHSVFEFTDPEQQAAQINETLEKMRASVPLTPAVLARMPAPAPAALNSNGNGNGNGQGHG